MFTPSYFKHLTSIRVAEVFSGLLVLACLLTLVTADELFTVSCFTWSNLSKDMQVVFCSYLPEGHCDIAQILSVILTIQIQRSRHVADAVYL